MAEKYCDIEYRGYLILISRITDEKLKYFNFVLRKEGQTGGDRYYIEKYTDLVSAISMIMKDIDNMLGSENKRMWFEASAELFEITYKYHRCSVGENIDGETIYWANSEEADFHISDESLVFVIESFRDRVKAKIEEDKKESKIKELLKIPEVKELLEDKDKRIAELEKEKLFLKRKLETIKIEIFKKAE